MTLTVKKKDITKKTAQRLCSVHVRASPGGAKVIEVAMTLGAVSRV